jgi:hypothetical protein
LHNPDDDPSCRFSSQKSGTELQKYFGRVQEGQQVLHLGGVNIVILKTFPPKKSAKNLKSIFFTAENRQKTQK